MGYKSPQMNIIGDRWVVAIDPGWTGFVIAYQKSTGSFVKWAFQKEKRIEIIKWALDFGKKHDIALIVKEQVGPRPRDSKGNVFAFGHSDELAYIVALALSAEIRHGYLEVTPSKWKNALALGRRNNGGKETTDDELKRIAQREANRTFKEICPFNITLANADAMMLCVYAQRIIQRSVIS